LIKEAEVGSRVRLSLWLSFALGSAVIALLTALVPHWIETVFGVDPDAGNGSAEWLIVIAAACASLLAALRVALHFRFAR
jgi:branched-subunit amino acid transport protein